LPSLPATSWPWRSGRRSCDRRSSASGTAECRRRGRDRRDPQSTGQAGRQATRPAARARHEHRGGRRTDRADVLGAPRRVATARTIARSPRSFPRVRRSAIARRQSDRQAGVPSVSRVATHGRRRRPAARSGRRRSSATSAPSGRSRSSAKASSRR
jgi:hypothetical protein